MNTWLNAGKGTAVSAVLIAQTVLFAAVTLQAGQDHRPSPKGPVLFNFQNQWVLGSGPQGVIQGEDGYLYGTTNEGGTFGFGIVYKLSPSGEETVLYNFTGAADGGYPNGSLAIDSFGDLYGVTSSGGDANACISGCGVVFKLDKQGNETVLYSFMGGSDGEFPTGVTLDKAGRVYGTTGTGGEAGAGLIFKIEPSGKETVLYGFKGDRDGNGPNASLIIDSAGNLYGTTSNGGLQSACGGPGCGVVFKLDQLGNESVLYTFTGAADGANPAGVIRGWDGNLYGTAGGGSGGDGVVYKLDTSGKQTVLFSFDGGADGGALNPGIVQDEAGNLYGGAVDGGEPGGCYGQGCGVLYELDKTGALTVLHTFTGGADGGQPIGNLVLDSHGNLSTAGSFGLLNQGVVLTVDKAGKEELAYSFPGSASGTYPSSGVVRDLKGNLFGTTTNGGPADDGVVYKLDSWRNETTLRAFKGEDDGKWPIGGLVLDAAGNVYGNTALGGDYNACPDVGCGVVFRLDAEAHESVLYSFKGGRDGNNPSGTLLRDSAGNLYGNTSAGGNTSECYGQGCGVVFRVDSLGKETVLYAFSGADGSYPRGSLILDWAGNLYGTTLAGGASNAGVVFKLDTLGQENVLYSFLGGSDGNLPNPGLIRDSVGNLYGTTAIGGAWNAGVIFKLDNSGNETVLYSFTGGVDGAVPNGGLVRDSAGNLYGVTNAGGNLSVCNGYGCGVVFELTPSGTETVLYAFNDANGSGPSGSLILDPTGYLYGVAEYGGTESGGVVFKVPTVMLQLQ